MELPLSAHVNIASLVWSLDCIIFTVWTLCCVWLFLEWELLFCFKVFMRSATRCLYMPPSELESLDTAFSASKFMSCIQFFCFVCKLYLRPFFSRDT